MALVELIGSPVEGARPTRVIQGTDTLKNGDELKAILSIPEPAGPVEDSTASTVGELVTDFNNLLAELRTAGVLVNN